MTVQELIDALSAIEDKSLPVAYVYADNHNYEIDITAVSVTHGYADGYPPPRTICALEAD